MQFIHFTQGATDPLEEFEARGVRYVPLAAGEGERDATVSCLHFASGGRIAEVPCLHDTTLLVVFGYLTVWGYARLDLSAGMGVVLDAGEPAQLESKEGAIVIAIESPRLIATPQGISTPERISGQHWPGEPPPRKERFGSLRRVVYRVQWSQSTPLLLRKLIRGMHNAKVATPPFEDHRLPGLDTAPRKKGRRGARGL